MRCSDVTFSVVCTYLVTGVPLCQFSRVMVSVVLLVHQPNQVVHHRVALQIEQINESKYFNLHVKISQMDISPSSHRPLLFRS
jgi:hypothetical protein